MLACDRRLFQCSRQLIFRAFLRSHVLPQTSFADHRERVPYPTIRHRIKESSDNRMSGATTAQIMDVTGHRNPKSLRRYTRHELLHDPSAFSHQAPRCLESEAQAVVLSPQIAGLRACSVPLATIATALRRFSTVVYRRRNARSWYVAPCCVAFIRSLRTGVRADAMQTKQKPRPKHRAVEILVRRHTAQRVGAQTGHRGPVGRAGARCAMFSLRRGSPPL
jgi:hypothetical protein